MIINQKIKNEFLENLSSTEQINIAGFEQTGGKTKCSKKVEVFLSYVLALVLVLSFLCGKKANAVIIPTEHSVEAASTIEYTETIPAHNSEEFISILNKIKDGESFEKKKIVLESDIEISDNIFDFKTYRSNVTGYAINGIYKDSVHKFNGTLNGNGHTINCKPENQSWRETSFFPDIEEKGIIENVNIKCSGECFISNNYGTINNCSFDINMMDNFIDWNYGTISNCTGKISGDYKDRVKGYFISTNCGIISKCSIDVDWQVERTYDPSFCLGREEFAPICLYNCDSINCCSVRGSIVAKGNVDFVQTLSGIATTNKGVICGCSFDGTIEGSEVAGIVGDNYEGVVNCTVSGKFLANKATDGKVGGIVLRNNCELYRNYKCDFWDDLASYVLGCKFKNGIIYSSGVGDPIVAFNRRSVFKKPNINSCKKSNVTVNAKDGGLKSRYFGGVRELIFDSDTWTIIKVPDELDLNTGIQYRVKDEGIPSGGFSLGFLLKSRTLTCFIINNITEEKLDLDILNIATIKIPVDEQDIKLNVYRIDGDIEKEVPSTIENIDEQNYIVFDTDTIKTTFKLK